MKRTVIAVLICACAVFGHAATVADLPAPPGFTRVKTEAGTFAAWLRGLPLKRDARIRLHEGHYVASGRYSLFAVLDVPMLFTTDLEQCADYCMRLWADWHRDSSRLDALYLFNYDGGRSYYKGSGKSYAAFLKWAFTYSNSHSLKTGCRAVDKADLAAGDIVVQNDTGGIGHVSMILDACTDGKGHTLFLMGFSFMPAQEFHVEKAPPGYGTAGWFDMDAYLRYLAVYYPFGEPVLRRF